MAILDDRNKTVVTIGIALVSLALGTVLITTTNDSQKEQSLSQEDSSGKYQANILAGASDQPQSSKNEKDKNSGGLKPKNAQLLNTQAPVLVSVTPISTPTPFKTPQTPTPTPSLLPTRTPTPSPTSTQIPAASPSPITQTSTPIPTPTPAPTQSNNTSIIINEVGWMGTEVPQTGQYGEWIELYNDGAVQVDLSGWKVLVSGELLLNLSGTINPNQYFLIERVTPSSPDPIVDVVSDISVSFGSGGLNNSGDRLELADSTGAVIDLVDCSGGWFAGSNASPKKSMERKGPSFAGSSLDSWASNDGIKRNGTDKNGVSINGTPGTKNSQEI